MTIQWYVLIYCIINHLQFCQCPKRHVIILNEVPHVVIPTRIMTYFPSYCMCVLFSNVSHLCTVFQSLEIRDQCYVEAIETLQRLSTCLTPAEFLVSFWAAVSELGWANVQFNPKIYQSSIIVLMVNDFSIIEFTFQALVRYTSKTDGLRFYEIDILIYVCGLNTCQWFNIITCLSHPKRRHTSSIVSFHPPDSTPSTALWLS